MIHILKLWIEALYVQHMAERITAKAVIDMPTASWQDLCRRITDQIKATCHVDWETANREAHYQLTKRRG